MMEFFKQLLSRDFTPHGFCYLTARGTAHLIEIWNVWHGSHLLAGAIKGVTAAVSVITVAILIPLSPKVISPPGRIL
jgi:hypothetical protein